MKNYIFYLDQYQIKNFFYPIRSKVSVINVLMDSIKLMKSYIEPDVGIQGGMLVLNIDKMSRLFFIVKDKYFSINFPFTVSYSETSGFIFSTNFIEDIDAKIASDIKSIIYENHLFNQDCLVQMVEHILDIKEQYLWALLTHVLTMEDGYIRYDNDPENGNGDLHPIHHYDVCYSSSATFKIGLHDEINHDDFINLLNITSDCLYLN